MSRPLSFHQLNALDLTPAELVRTAGKAGFDHVCVITQGTPEGGIDFPLVTAGPVARDMAAALADTGLRVFNIEVFFITPGVDLDAYMPALELGRSLGGTRASAIIADPDLARAADAFRRFAEMAKSIDVRACIEFMTFSTVNSIVNAASFVQAAGVPTQSLTLDTLHFVRTRSAPADLASLDPQLVGSVQINDGRVLSREQDAAYTLEARIAEAMAGRTPPGQGEFPLSEILAWLPADCGISVEAPNSELRARHPDALAWARTLYRATRDVLAAAGQPLDTK